jgi:hypothetical protein
MIRLIAGSQCSQSSIGTPQSEAPTISFAITVWSWSCYYPHASLLCIIKEALEVLSGSLEVIDIFRWRVIGPKEVDAV